MKKDSPSGRPPKPQLKKTYRTQQGDTLRLVASKFQLDPEALKSANNLRQAIDAELKTGQELLIPSRQAIDAVVRKKPTRIIKEKDKVGPIKEKTNPFDESVIKGLEDEPWSEWDPYDPDTDWSQGAPAWKEGGKTPADEVINPADLNIKNISKNINTKKKITGE